MLNYKLLQTDELSEALDYLSQYQKIKMISGGTDILVDLHNDEIDNEEMNFLLDISNIKELKKIKQEKEYIEVGALVTHNTLIEDKNLSQHYPVLEQAAKTIGSIQIRNRGTIGGNIVNASPAADLLPPLIALEAVVVLQSQKGEREMTIPEFITGPYDTDISDNEILTKIKIPIYEEKYYSNFQKIGRRKAVAIARLNTAVVAKINEDNRFTDTRIVPGSATPSPQVFSGVEQEVNGQHIDEIDYQKVGKRAAEEMVSITGERWSTPYKKPAITTLVKRALEGIAKEAKQDE
jgi:carbon-monoxide dehydrogenase medium subunit/xanthine dehydrogenase FAD-binding subunit